MTSAVLAQGATITFGGTPVPEVTNLDMGYDSEQLEVTSHDSPNSAREYIAGLITPQEVTFTVNYTDADHGFLTATIGDSSSPDTLSVTGNDGGTISVDGWVKGCVVHYPATGAAQTADITIQTTGPMSFGGSS